VRTLARSCIAVLALCLAGPADAAGCPALGELIDKGCRRLVDTYENGSNELLVSGYSWHLPWTWTAERRAEENENAWGGGWARTVEQPNGDTESVFALIFSDSHKKPEYNLGYAWSTYWGERQSLQGGLGFTLALVSRCSRCAIRR
jgi:palmitoyl transferase